MEINKISLCHFASSTDGTTKQGYLQIEAKEFQQHKDLWCSLKGNLLFYFNCDGDIQPIGVIVLEQCSVKICDISKQFSFSVEFSQSQVSYIIVSQSREDMEDWVRAISRSSHAFISEMIEDMEKTLKRLKFERKTIQCLDSLSCKVS